MLALAFGRIGCFLNGCCFGKPTSLPWGVRFPYGSFAYRSQIQANPQRNRLTPRLNLPEEYFGYNDEKGYYWQDLKPAKYLTPQQKELVTRGKYRCLAVHPTQLYSSAIAALICLVLFLFWRRSQKAESAVGGGNFGRLFTKPGSTFALTFILYGTARFLMEFVRDDNPFEIDSLTISQVMGIGLIILGGILAATFSKMRPERLPAGARNAAAHHHHSQKAVKSQ
jgi:phosphatidylglycerol:prolipoprotein diacylglycerol transferase